MQTDWSFCITTGHGITTRQTTDSDMKKLPFRRSTWISGPTLLIGALLTILPGIDYKFRLPGSIDLTKRSSGLYNTFRVRTPAHAVKYEWNPLSSGDPCWGPEGYSTSPNRFYFRFRSLEVAGVKL